MNGTINNIRARRFQRCAALSIVELLLSLSISAIILTATAAAFNTAFNHHHKDIYGKMEKFFKTRLKSYFYLVKIKTLDGSTNFRRMVTPEIFKSRL